MYSTPILANILSEASRFSREYADLDYTLMMIGGIAILVVMGVILYLLDRISRKSAVQTDHKQTSALELLRNELNLSDQDVDIISSVAKHLELPAVELLFVDPELWKEETIHRPHLSPAITTVMNKLFGEQITADSLS
ncbi:MAG: hypothetical protein KDA78_06140 [Planctomycetaceae bacterium]|nr:hypothetical protein [Planctomycetaceae bacterium]